MADILLTHGYFLHEDEKEQQIMRPYPPLGLMYLSAYLKRAGVEVDLYDSTLGTRAELLARLSAQPPAIVGLYTNLMTRQAVLDIAAAARANGSALVLGGPESANYPAEYLAHGADVIVVGEGEATLAELVPALADRGRHRLHDVAGVVFRDEAGEVVTTTPRPQIADLDSLPWPDRAAVDLPRYMDIWRRHHGAGSVTLITARGCPYKCNWCSHAVYGFTHRRRSVMDCANELEFVRDTYRPDQVWYADDVFTIHHRWLYDYDAELKRRGLRLPFETISRADRMMHDHVLEALASLGCYRIWIGAESGSQRVLDAMERGVTRNEVIWASKAARRHGIQVGMFLMWGYDGETTDDIEQTIDLVKQANPDVFLTTVAYPIKNTGYFAKVAGHASLSRSWATASDRDFVVEGRPGRAYYRDVDTWLRHDVAADRERQTNPPSAASHRAAAAAARYRVMAARPAVAPSALAFDGLAAGYDPAFTETPIGRRLRASVWRRLDARFSPGDRVLEVNCGTGEDAVYLARRGVQVLATDIAPAMVEAARRKVAAAGLEAGVQVECLAMEDVGPALGTFDGALSDFGGLNCVADLRRAARALARCVRPGGVAVVGVMGPIVPWEWVWYLAHGAPRQAFRRLRRGGVEWRGVTIRYPSIRRLRAAFAPEFEVMRVAALGALLPPPYAGAWAARHPRVLAMLDRAERAVETLYPLPHLADHYLAELRRSEG